MTEHNHRRGTKRKNNKVYHIHQGTRPNEYFTETYPDKPDLQLPEHESGGFMVALMSNGYAPKKPYKSVDRTRVALVKTSLSDRLICAKGVGYGRGKQKAKVVRGAKKFIRTRTRFHENAATRKLGMDYGKHED